MIISLERLIGGNEIGWGINRQDPTGRLKLVVLQTK